MLHAVAEEVAVIHMSEPQTCVQRLCLRLVLVHDQTRTPVSQRRRPLNMRLKDARRDAHAPELWVHAHRIEVKLPRLRATCRAGGYLGYGIHVLQSV